MESEKIIPILANFTYIIKIEMTCIHTRACELIFEERSEMSYCNYPLSPMVKVKLYLCSEHHAIKAYLETGVTVSLILDLGTRWS